MISWIYSQDAEIGDQYDEFPAVLQLHLKRFEYDFERDIRVKVRCMDAGNTNRLPL